MSKSASYQWFEGVIYPDSESYNCDTRKEVIKAVFPEWAFALHDKDFYTEKDEQENPKHKAGTLKKPHIHWVGRLDINHKRTLSGIAKDLCMPENDISIPKDYKPFKAAVRYLAHLDSNPKDKYIYDSSIIESNFDIHKIIETKLDETAKVQLILNFILESRCTSVIGLTQWCIANNCWDAYRRASSIFQGVLREMRDIV